MKNSKFLKSKKQLMTKKIGNNSKSFLKFYNKKDKLSTVILLFYFYDIIKL